MDAKEVLEALRNATPVEREHLKSLLRHAFTRNTLEKYLDLAENSDGTWTVTGTPEQFRRLMES